MAADDPTILAARGVNLGNSSLCATCAGPLPVQGCLNGVCPSCLARSMTWVLGEDDVEGDAFDFFDSPPPSVRGYRIGALAGSGGLGLVFRATREEDGMMVALKVLSSRWTSDIEQIARFEREAAMLASLSHPHIVRFIDSGKTENGDSFLITEFVEGVDLRRKAMGRPLPPTETLKIFSQICLAVEHAHGAGIVHRDLKPSNVLIALDGTVKVADFGIAKAPRQTLSDLSITKSNVAIGTPYYMAPECLRQLSNSTPQSDIYSLGVMLYELLTGSLPIGSFIPASRKTGLDQRIDSVISQALAEDPARRFSSVRVFRDAVKRLTSRRRWRLWLAVTASVMGLGGLVAGSVHVQREQERIKSRPELVAAPLRPYVNELGMKFIPLPEHNVLFSLWETRIQDYEAFVRDENDDDFTVVGLAIKEHLSPGPKTINTKPGGKPPAVGMRIIGLRGWEESLGYAWNDPGWPTTPEHPACGISYDEAVAFCQWLTAKERASKRISANHTYRLPTSTEWQDAANRPSATTETGNKTAEFVWGDAWPPPRNAGNLTGREVSQPPWPGWSTLDYEDGYPRTAPVGQFTPSALGFFDLEGNVKEWCAPLPGGDSTRYMPLRGAAWGVNAKRELFRVAYLSLADPTEHHSLHGFRCVLEYPAPEGK